MTLRKIYLLIYFFLLLGCGFQPINLDKNFSFAEINTSGDKRINYKLKNKLLTNSEKDNNNLIQLFIKTKKIKSIKEKNISNEITKYNIKLNVDIKYDLIGKNISNEFTLSKKGDYNVSTKYSDTLNNEKHIIDLLVGEVSDDILRYLENNFNDL